MAWDFQDFKRHQNHLKTLKKRLSKDIQMISKKLNKFKNGVAFVFAMYKVVKVLSTMLFGRPV